MNTGPLGDYPQIPLRHDPRIGNRPPDWLPTDGWRTRLDALTDADVAWLQDQWEVGGEPDPTAWITMETIGSPLWPFLTGFCVFLVLLVGYTVWAVQQ